MHKGAFDLTLTRHVLLLLVMAVLNLSLLGDFQPVFAADQGSQVTRACPSGMVYIPGGIFKIGAGAQLPEEQAADAVSVSPFCMEAHEVRNRQFADFVATTGYVTVAERPLSSNQFPGLTAAERRPGSVVFQPPHVAQPFEVLSWWRWTPGADWRHPEGPGSDLHGRDNHPVVQVAFEDAQAYARWAGRSLPSEAQWEFAARGGLRDRIYAWGNTYSPIRANTWQGEFPVVNTAVDGFVGTAPVGTFEANAYGLFDMTGNVWEWTEDWYRVGHEGMAHRLDPLGAAEQESSDPREPGVAKHVIKGGSFLCSPQYCSRYRPAAREAQSPDTGTSYIGFRLVSASRLPL